jgi:hypothetical protein
VTRESDRRHRSKGVELVQPSHASCRYSSVDGGNIDQPELALVMTVSAGKGDAAQHRDTVILGLDGDESCGGRSGKRRSIALDRKGIGYAFIDSGPGDPDGD